MLTLREAPLYHLHCTNNQRQKNPHVLVPQKMGTLKVVYMWHYIWSWASSNSDTQINLIVGSKYEFQSFFQVVGGETQKL